MLKRFYFLLLALAPFVFFVYGIEWRYTYMAAAPLAILLAIALDDIAAYAASRTRAQLAYLAAAAALLAATVYLGHQSRLHQTWIRQQSGYYEALYREISAACGPFAPGAELHLINNPAFDPYGFNVPSVFNLYFDRVLVRSFASREERDSSGAVNNPLRVVAPISVNGLRFICMLRALGPLSIMISMR